MPILVTRAEMDAVSKDIYPVLPAQFRDVLSADTKVSSQTTRVFRGALQVMPRVVNELFALMKYVEGSDWLMWKLLATLYMIEKRIGPNSVRTAGEHIYTTMPWPPVVKSIEDALRFVQAAYLDAHMQAAPEVIGCWRVQAEQRGRMALVDATPYPCGFGEGVVAGICTTFYRQRPTYMLADPNAAKRAGSLTTLYDIRYDAT
jgi:hypothetical protein